MSTFDVSVSGNGRYNDPRSRAGLPRFGVWIDQDLCTGDGLCTDYAPDVFVILDDGIAYVRDGETIGNDPGGPGSVAPVPSRLLDQVLTAADLCPGECIFVEEISESTRLMGS